LGKIKKKLGKSDEIIWKQGGEILIIINQVEVV
jgi:hypothetical protein